MSPKSFTTTYAGSKTTFQNASSQANQSSSYAHANSVTRGTTYNAKAAQQIFQMPNPYDLSKSSDLTATLWVDNSLGSIFSDVGRGIGSGAKTFVKNTGKLGRDMVYHAADFYTFGYAGSKLPAVRAATQRQTEASSALFTNTGKAIAHPVNAVKSIRAFAKSSWKDNVAIPYEQGDYQTLAANATGSVLFTGSVWFGGGAQVAGKVGSAATRTGRSATAAFNTAKAAAPKMTAMVTGSLGSTGVYLVLNGPESTPAGITASAGLGSFTGLGKYGLNYAAGVESSLIPKSVAGWVNSLNSSAVGASLGLSKKPFTQTNQSWFTRPIFQAPSVPKSQHPSAPEK